MTAKVMTKKMAAKLIAEKLTRQAAVAPWGAKTRCAPRGMSDSQAGRRFVVTAGVDLVGA
jgi:hypothetical protein